MLVRGGGLAVENGTIAAGCGDSGRACVCYPAMGKGQWAATTEFKINLTAPVRGGSIEARAEILNLSRSQAVVRIDMLNDGRTCAMAQGTVTIHNPR